MLYKKKNGDVKKKGGGVNEWLCFEDDPQPQTAAETLNEALGNAHAPYFCINNKA